MFLQLCQYSDYATGSTIGVLGLDSRQGLGIFHFTALSRPALGPTQPPIQWVPEALSLGVKRPGSEADYSPPSSAEVRNARSCYTSTPPIHLSFVWLIQRAFLYWQSSQITHVECLKARIFLSYQAMLIALFLLPRTQIRLHLAEPANREFFSVNDGDAFLDPRGWFYSAAYTSRVIAS
jgi:hypothetical protein